MPQKPWGGKHLLGWVFSGWRGGRLGLRGKVNLSRKSLKVHVESPRILQWGRPPPLVRTMTPQRRARGRTYPLLAAPPRRPQDLPGVRGEVVPHSGNHPGSGPELTHSAFRPVAAGEHAKRQMARSGNNAVEVIA